MYGAGARNRRQQNEDHGHIAPPAPTKMTFVRSQRSSRRPASPSRLRPLLDPAPSAATPRDGQTIPPHNHREGRKVRRLAGPRSHVRHRRHDALRSGNRQATQFRRHQLRRARSSFSAIPPDMPLPWAPSRWSNLCIEQVVQPSGEKIRVDWHGHCDRGLAIANSMAALVAGADCVHATALGIGERVGNTQMDQMLVNLKLMGIAPWDHQDLTRLKQYCETVSEATGRSHSRKLSRRRRGCISHRDRSSRRCSHQGL